MANLILILGGARSGKSSYAEKLALEFGQQVVYVATAEAKDEDMAARIKAHQKARPAHWQTVESPQNIASSLAELSFTPDVILLDCLTLLVSNILLTMESESTADIEEAVQSEIDALITTQTVRQIPMIIVSNEVGLGLIPAYPLGRIYRDLLGRANQYLAAAADRVLLMVAGIPMTIKDES